MYDLIIIGMGISGITAGIYAKRAGMKVLMLEKSIPGGLLVKIDKISNYPGYEEISGPDLALSLLNQVKKQEIPYKIEEVIKLENESDKKIVITSKGRYETKKVIIATGRVPKYLGLDNEKDYLGKGISTCATCDGALYKNEDVVVVGSGNSALSESLYLSNIVNKVYLVHRKESFTGEDELLKQVKDKENIVIIDKVTIDKINEKDGKIDNVVLSNGQVLDVKGVFIYIGYRPNTDIFKNLDILNDNGDIIVDNNRKTKITGIYAVGDCIKKDVYQLVTATSDGCIAVNYLTKE